MTPTATRPQIHPSSPLHGPNHGVPRSRVSITQVWVFRILSVLVFLVFGTLVAHRIGACAGDSDSSGYLNAARLIREGHLHEVRRLATVPGPGAYPDFLTTPLGFRPVGTHQMVPTYPLGLPAIIAALSLVVGMPQAPNLAIWLHAMGLLVTFSLLAKKSGLSPGWAVAGMVILGASPLVLGYSVQAMSDVPAALWVALTVLAVWPDPKGSAHPILAGLSFAMAVFIRPSNVLALLPVAVCLLGDWRRWLGFVLGGLPGGLLWMAMNRALFGKAVTTGYGDMGIFFGFHFVPATLLHYAVWLPVLLTPAVALSFGLPFLSRVPLRLRAVVLAWIVPWLAFYAAYRFTGTTWWYLRFLLPCFPAIVLAMMMTAREMSHRWNTRLRWAGGCAALLFSLAWSAHWTTKLFALNFGDGQLEYPRVIAEAKRIIPPDAPLLAMQVSGSLLYYTDQPFLRWDFIDPSCAEKLRQRAVERGESIYAILFPFEVEEVTTKRLPGAWTKLASVADVGIWRLQIRGPVRTGNENKPDASQRRAAVAHSASWSGPQGGAGSR